LAALLSGLYARRGGDFPSEQETLLVPVNAIRQLEKPTRLMGAISAAHLLHEALTTKTPIVIVGDFDVDGVSATAILMRALSPFTQTTAIIPDRKTEGYGLSPLLAERIPRFAGLVITVDNGISAVDGARVIRERGQKLLITDHHLPGDVLPEADAILNPNVTANGHTYTFPRSTCGAGVAWYLLWALRGAHPEWKERMPIRDLLSLVAVATVADVVPLERNNRLMVRIGLDIIRQGRGPLGLQALFRVAGRDPSQATATDCGFVVGPRLNAAGRMANMMTGLNLLLTEDDAAAQSLARELDAMNRERRQVEGTAMEEAVEQAVQSAGSHVKTGADRERDIMVLADPSWHEGVVGLMAGRLRERFGVPVFVFARSQHGGWKGSGRSVSGFHLRDLLAWVDARHPGLIGRFGGHAMAAGLSLSEDGVDDFRKVVQRYPAWLALRVALDEAGDTETDGALPSSLLNIDTAIAIRAAGPWGSGFPEPVFEGHFRVLDASAMKGEHWRLRIAPCSDADPYDLLPDGRPVAAVRFFRDTHGVDIALPAENAVLAIRYTLQVNHWRDEDNLQIVVDKCVQVSP
jgi:single-stranded-DNA-specific exonuclease